LFPYRRVYSKLGARSAKLDILIVDYSWAFDESLKLVGSRCAHEQAEHEILSTREHALKL
jgi:hypothetical protein